MKDLNSAEESPLIILCKYLIQNGADVHHEDAGGENLIDYKSILYYRTPEFIEWLKIQKIFK